MEASPGMVFLNKINCLRLGVAAILITKYQGLARLPATPCSLNGSELKSL
jgi:hypothetical protein